MQEQSFITDSPLHISADKLDVCRSRLAESNDKALLFQRAEKCIFTFTSLDPEVNDHYRLSPYAAGHHGAFLSLLHILSPDHRIEEALVNFLHWIPRQDALMWESGLGLGMFLKGAVLALDAVNDRFSISEQQEILETLILKCIDDPDPNALANNYPTGVIPYKKYLDIPGTGFHLRDEEVNNWDVVCSQGLLYVARAVQAICPERREQAVEWTRIAVLRLRRFLELSYSPEGEYCEGPGYYSYGNFAAITMLDLLQHWPEQETTLASLDTRGLLNTPHWLRSIYPGPISEGAFTFNDVHHGAVEAPAILYWIAARSRDPLAQYFGDAARASDQSTGMVDALMFAQLWRDDSVPSEDLSGPLTKSFGRYGSVVCRTGFHEDASTLLFRCGCHAGAHTHPDRGNILFSALGENFLVDAGMFSDRSQPIYAKYHTHAMAHNCLLAHGIGQFRPSNEDFAEGRLLTFRQDEGNTVVVGEYGNTYPPEAGVTSCQRMVFWSPAGWFLVYDRVEQQISGLRTLWHLDHRDRTTKIEFVQSETRILRPQAGLLVYPLLPEITCTDLGLRYQGDDPEGARLLAYDTPENESVLLFVPYAVSAYPNPVCTRISEHVWQITVNGITSTVNLVMP